MLAPGQLADLAVLSADYFTVPEEEIKGIESVLTMVGGKVVYGGGRVRQPGAAASAGQPGLVAGRPLWRLPRCLSRRTACPPRSARGTATARYGRPKIPGSGESAATVLPSELRGWEMLRPSGLIAAACGVLLFWLAGAEGQGPQPSAPKYQLNRADEDYLYLQDKTKATDFWDPVKYLRLNDRGTWYLSLGGEARERYEYFANNNWGAGPQDAGGYFLQRYFLHGDLHLGDGVRFFSQLQSSLENGRRGGPRPTDRDELDLHQAFLDLKLGTGGSGSLTLRSGRQELAYGSQRLVSVREGPNVRQSFDGFRAMYRADQVKLDAFATKPVQTKRQVFDDGPDQSQALWGAYSVLPLPLLSEASVDLYYFGLLRRQARFDQGPARELRHSVGTRSGARKDRSITTSSSSTSGGAMETATSVPGPPPRTPGTRAHPSLHPALRAQGGYRQRRRQPE